MPSKIRRIDYFPDEMIAGVAGQLQAVDFGIYWMICTLIYSRGGAIDNDHLWMSRLFRKTHWRVVRASIDRLIESGKVQEESGKLMVLRCENELQRARKRVAGMPQEARKKGAREPQEVPVSNENSDIRKLSTINQQLSTINHQPSVDEIDKSAKRASRLPEDWQPCERAIEYAQQKGLSENEISRLRDDIVDWSRGSRNGAKLDWLATWQTWVRRRIDERESPGQFGRGTSPAGNRQSGTLSRSQAATAGILGHGHRSG